MDYHSKKIEECLKNLHSSAKGLNFKEAEKRQGHYGFNEIPKEKQLGSLKIFFLQFHNALVYILVFAGTLSLILREYVDAGVIFGAVILNVIIGFFQENKANKAIAKLKELVEHKAMVLRGGNEMLVESRQLTVGDVIIINAGNRIPADARLIEANDLQINEASLTGESLPSNKIINSVPLGAALADRENMVFAGTMAVRGIGKAVVTAIGAKTEIGKIASLVKDTKEEETPLQIRLKKFSRILGLVFAAICLLIVITGLLQGRGLLEMVETGAAVGVASIPEGMTVAVTVILALGMQQILKKKALTRKLIAAETLGSTSVICSDKTGTLTQGNMHVAHIVIGEKEYELVNPGSRQNGKEAKSVSLALQIGMMCNNATIENPEDELAGWRINGTPTETALLSAAIQSGLRKEKFLEIEPRIDELPFDSEKKYMLSLHRRDSDNYVLYEKGAPEILLKKAEYFHHLGKIRNITEKERQKLIKTSEDLTSRGLRVIGLGVKNVDKKNIRAEEGGDINWENIDKDIIFVGFIALKDPLRPEAKETIALCRQAGIRPILITGDHKLTARAIGREVGLDVKSENIIVGPELEKISDEELKKIVKKIDIYARVSPHHKLRIVKSLQETGEVVAMTGDGINDSPALKASDIGISLGTGTDIAKETSDIVLLDDNFKTIVGAIKQGRIIFKNIRKVITFLISDSFSEMTLIIGSIIFNTPLALLPTQILWINIINDGLPHFSLAFETDHGSVMKEKPIARNVPLLNQEMKYIIFGAGIIRDLVLFLIFYLFWLQWKNDPLLINYLITVMFATLGIKSLMSIFSLRSFSTAIWRINPLSNKYMLMAVAASFIFLLLGIYWGPLQKILHTVDLDILGWSIAIGMGIFSILLIELVKIFVKNK